MDANENPMEVVVDDSANATVILKPSEGEQKPSTEMLTREQAEKLANERHSKLDARIAELAMMGERATKALEAAKNRADAAEKAVRDAQKAAEDAERRALGDDPDALSLFEAKAAHREAVARLEGEKEELVNQRAELADDIAEVKQYKVTKLADEIAEAGKDAQGHKVDPALLIQLTDGSKEAMEKLAKVLPLKEAGGDAPNLTKPPAPDSGRRSTAFGNATAEQRQSWTMEQYAAWFAEYDKKK